MSASILAFDAGFLRLLSAIEDPQPPDMRPDHPDVSVGDIRRLNPAGWRDLYTACRDDLFRYALSRLGNPEEAEDAVGDALEEALKAAPRLEDRGLPPRAWLFGVIRNVVNRRRRLLFRSPPPLDLGALQPTADGGLPARLELLDLARLLRRLPSSQAEVVLLRFVHGLSLDETAFVLGEKPGAVRARQGRALRRLRLWLEDARPVARETLGASRLEGDVDADLRQA